MTNTKDDDQKDKVPYEAPRLFDLGGGVAHAADKCAVGGSPAGKCKDGNMASSDVCKSGGMAGKKNCGNGGLPKKKCKDGSMH